MLRGERRSRAVEVVHGLADDLDVAHNRILQAVLLEGVTVGQAAFGFLKKLLVAYAKFVDVNFGIRIKRPTICFAFVRGSKITLVSPSFEL